MRGLFIAIPLVVFVLLLAWFFARRSKKRAARPGQLLYYTVPGRSAAACHILLTTPAPEDIFHCELKAAPNGGWYLHLLRHNPTGQQVDTLFLLVLQGDGPALVSLRFVREAFGMREPVMGEELLNAFFAQKLGALRARPPAEPDGPKPKT